jgi:hypothetical protein
MAGQRQAGSAGMDVVQPFLDDGTMCRAATPLPGTVGYTAPPAAARATDSWFDVQQIAFGVLGPQSFAAGVVYGLGEGVVTSAADLARLAMTFVLADLYEHSQRRGLALTLDPLGPVKALSAHVLASQFGDRLREAYDERQALIAELRYAITHPGEVFENIKDEYATKWARFEALSTQRTLSSQFEAGRIVGEVLLDVLSLVGGGVVVVKATSKIPRLARLARRMARPSAPGAAPGLPAARPTTPSARARGGAQERPAERPAAAVKPPKRLSKDELADWYRKQGDRFNDRNTLENHLEGTDFSKPVVLRELPAGTEVVQYVRADGKPGMYFAKPGTPMEMLGIKEPPPRVVQRFVLEKPVEVVESTAATLGRDLAPGVGGTGGGQQLIFPKGWESSVGQVR